MTHSPLSPDCNADACANISVPVITWQYRLQCLCSCPHANIPARLSPLFVYTLYSEAAPDFPPLLARSSLVHTPTNNHPWISLIHTIKQVYLSTCSQHPYYRTGAAKKGYHENIRIHFLGSSVLLLSKLSLRQPWLYEHRFTQTKLMRLAWRLS